MNAMLLTILAAVTTISASPSAWTAQKPAVQTAILHKNPNLQISSILIKQSYALVSAKGFKAVLRRGPQGWSVTCELNTTTISAQALQSSCGVPGAVAGRLAADEPINVLANEGNFRSAATAQQQIVTGASAPESPTEIVRLQQLNMLDTEMRLQQITRGQAIQQWSQLQYSWLLP